MNISNINKFSLVLLVLAPLLAAGCGEPELDVSSEKVYQKSLKSIYKNVPKGDREEFRKNYSAVLGEKLRIDSSVLSEEEMYGVYNAVNDFGGDEDADNLLTFSGLTINEITQRGRSIRTQKLKPTLQYLKEQIQNLEKEVEQDKIHAEKSAQVEVIYDGIEAQEGFNMEIFNSIKKPWGTVGLFEVFITVKNNSSESITKIHGSIHIADKDGGLGEALYLANLTPADSDELAPISDLKIAPGTEWRGKVILDFTTPNQKYPFPPATEYKGTLSGVKSEFHGNTDPDGSLARARVEKLKKAKKYLNELEQELASIQ